MAKKKESNDSAIKILRILTWPFLMLFKLLSWIVQMLTTAIDHLINTSRKRESVGAESTYVPLKIIDTESGSYNQFETFLAKNPSTIGIILGARGSGKTAIGLKLLENLHTMSRKHIYAMGFKPNEMPPWVHIVESLNDITNNSYILIDEGGILFSARKSFSDANKLLSELLLIARHKDLSVIFISQNSANLEINAIRQADYLILKPSSLMQLDFERKRIKDIYTEVADKFKRYKKKGLTYIYSDKFKGFVSNELPGFWTEKISKSFR